MNRKISRLLAYVDKNLKRETGQSLLSLIIKRREAGLLVEGFFRSTFSQGLYLYTENGVIEGMAIENGKTFATLVFDPDFLTFSISQEL